MQKNTMLRTGVEVFAPYVAAVTFSLKRLIDQQPVAFYELVMVARNPRHTLFGNAHNTLYQLSLIESDGRLSEDARAIILASIEGEGLDTKLISPVDPQQVTQARASERTRDLRDVEFYARTRRVAGFIMEKCRGVGSLWMEDRSGESPNPFYNQTADGLFLEYYYSGPSTLWTPWGKWGFVGSAGHSGDLDLDAIFRPILTGLGAIEYQAVRETQMGVYGPVYALHQVDGTPLPDPVELEEAAYASYEDVKAAWEELTQLSHTKPA